jgi:transcriptional regulator with XRE-family HTH domain
MEISERLQYIMKLNNLTASAFADKIEVQRSSISHILSGRNKPSLEFIQKVLHAFPKISADWLITGNTSAPTEIVTSEVKSEPETTYTSPTSPKEEQLKHKSIKKIVVFYTDNTFEEFNR